MPIQFLSCYDSNPFFDLPCPREARKSGSLCSGFQKLRYSHWSLCSGTWGRKESHWRLLSKVKAAQSCPTLCDPMDHSPWNSLGQNTGVGSSSLLQGIFPTQELNSGLPHWRGFFTSWVTREAQEYWSGLSTPSPADLPNPGIKAGSPALQADSLPPELSGKL